MSVEGFDAEQGSALRSIPVGPDAVEQDAGGVRRESQVVPRGSADDELGEEREGVRDGGGDREAASSLEAGARPAASIALEPAAEPAPGAERSDAGAAPEVPALAAAPHFPEVVQVPEAAASEGAPPSEALQLTGAAPTLGAAEAQDPFLHETPRAPRHAIREWRAAARATDLGTTLLGPAFGPDEDDEATMVDAGAELSETDRGQPAQQSRMNETLPAGTPAPAAAMPSAPERAPKVADNGHLFKQTMMLGLPLLVPPSASGAEASPGVASPGADVPAPPSTCAPEDAPAPSAAVLASMVRVVGPPTQPPPRRVRRGVGGTSIMESGPLSAPDDLSDFEHEAFALSNPIGNTDAGRRSSVPAPPPAAEGEASASLSSLLLPRPAAPVARADDALGTSAARMARADDALGTSAARMARADDAFGASSARAPRADGHLGTSLSRSSRDEGFVIAPPAALASVGAVSARSLSARSVELPQRSSYPPPLRVTIDPPAAHSRTRPPMARSAVGLHSVEEMQMDPFAGFAAPTPSLAQRWLVVIVVALAVVGLCSLAAIAFGLLGKTGW